MLKRCTKCGQEFPATDEFFPRDKKSKDCLRSHCKTCKNTYQREYHSLHDARERDTKYQKEYASRPEVQAHKKTYKKAYYSNPEIRERENSRHKAWFRSPEGKAQNRIYAHNRRIRRKALAIPGTHTPQESLEQYQRQKGKCYWCQQKVIWGKHHEDHVIPVTHGGSNDISNIVITHPTCNQRKGNKFPWEWPEGGKLL